ncbi:Predicted flavoprotein CzcO associated with the cation diffusion facilitator CzcD [Amycolatopsis arida]|uniref:Predicted flavoprotein CzcO associated with the cation diffusion facilitator CzcD n=1 Tax=Amycolatopsis arida TaxID=587909 RepID=A0A1I5V7Q8_9PSEU|nr:NAD(P)/FAD-dependent oxidoreductase [Amycolatopsis arida]TDX91176.1 cation diffusion facilitator CzcD-associated flavoprotein CzcO [Amycolatopsis arida]SFQ03397.1 Predicted flavoprotein CzcO associated with the cation diffusion facilitator CzcD [Amycolatopsis arida]
MTSAQVRQEHAGTDAERHVHVAVVGAGLSGIAAAVKLRGAGITDLVVLEKADRVGGTWRDNTYPGCAVDIPSPVYSFSFHPNPDWSRLFASQPELLAYIEDTIERFDLAGVIRLGTELREARWAEERRRWVLDTSAGPFVARHVVFAAGLLHEPKIPDLPGLAGFPGAVFHSARWDHDVELAGRRVAVVGTGCSAVQIVPEIQPVVEHLYVFQRTPAWVVPRLDFRFSPRLRRLLRRHPVTQRLLRGASDLVLRTLALLLRRGSVARLLTPAGKWLLRRQVPDPVLRRQVTPDFTLGCKRLLLSNTYLPALGRRNVTLVPHALAAVEGRELVAADGGRVTADVLVLGSGFELRHPPIADRIRRRDGRLLSEVWSATSPEAYRATTVPGMPNAYLLLGPNIVMYNSLLALAEAQLDYVVDAIRTADARGLEVLEVRAAPFRSFNEEVQRGLSPSVYNNGGCSSFYLDERGRNFVTWPWSLRRLRRELSRFDLENYETVPARGRGRNP